MVSRNILDYLQKESILYIPKKSTREYGNQIETNIAELSQKFILKNLPAIKLLLILLALMSICSCDSMSGNNHIERELMDRIGKGMSKKEVIEILGNPDYTEVIRDSIKYGEAFYFFTKNKSGLRTEMPFVYFDSTGHVRSWYY